MILFFVFLIIEIAACVLFEVGLYLLWLTIFHTKGDK